MNNCTKRLLSVHMPKVFYARNWYELTMVMHTLWSHHSGARHRGIWSSRPASLVYTVRFKRTRAYIVSPYLRRGKKKNWYDQFSGFCVLLCFLRQGFSVQPWMSWNQLCRPQTQRSACLWLPSAGGLKVCTQPALSPSALYLCICVFAFCFFVCLFVF